jgi:hypothetical protein
MIHRLVTTSLSPDDATTEVNEIKTIAKINGYSEEFVEPYSQQTQEERGASKPADLDSCFEKRRCTDECHHVLSGHHEQTTKDFPEPSN